MGRILTQIVLYGSPVCITIALSIVAFAIHAIGRGFGGTKSAVPIVLAAFVVWLLHAGYLLGPWLYNHQRQTTALWLMVPVAIIGILVALLIANQLVPDDRANDNGVFLLCCTAWTAAVLFGYVGPIIVMLVEPPARVG